MGVSGLLRLGVSAVPRRLLWRRGKGQGQVRVRVGSGSGQVRVGSGSGSGQVRVRVRVSLGVLVLTSGCSGARGRPTVPTSLMTHVIKSELDRLLDDKDVLTST